MLTVVHQSLENIMALARGLLWLKETKYESIHCTSSIGSVGWSDAYGNWWSADPIKKAISIFLTHRMTELEQLTEVVGLELYEAIDIFSNYSKENF